MHWCLLEVSIPEQRIQYYDSYGSSGKEYLQGMLRYLEDEWKDLGNCGDFSSEWKVISTTKETPRQKDGYNCGVFLCTCARYISEGLELTYTQKDITMYRRRIALDILMIEDEKAMVQQTIYQQKRAKRTDSPHSPVRPFHDPNRTPSPKKKRRVNETGEEEGEGRKLDMEE